MDINKICQKIEELDSLITSNEKTDIKTVRDCLHQPLTWLSRELVKQNSWKRHVWFVLNTILPQWSFLLTSSAKEEIKAITTTLMGKKWDNNRSTQEIKEENEEEEDQQLCLAMVQISLPLLLESIQEQQQQQNIEENNKRMGSMQLLYIYAAQLKHMVSASMITIYLQQAKHIHDISFFSSMLFAIPSRLSNAFGLQHMVNVDLSNMDNTWYLDRNFYVMMAKNIALELDSIYHQIKQSNKTKIVDKKLDMAGELVGKMMRQGYQDICMNTMLPMAVQQYTLYKDPYYSDLWIELWIQCEKMIPREKLYNSIIQYLNTYLEPHRQNILYNSNNGNGDDYIKTALQNLIQSTAYLISPLLFSKCTSSELTESSSPSSNIMHIKRIQDFLTYLFTGVSKVKLMDSLVLRLVMAIAMHSAGIIPLDSNEVIDEHVYKLSQQAKEILTHSLKPLTDLWGDPIFINHSSDSEHLYVTTGILIHFGYSDKMIMEDILYSTSLGMEISSWLKTADAANAKLGMLVAECLSARTKNNDEEVLEFGIPMEQRLIDLKQLAFVADGLTKIVETSQSIPIVTEPIDESSESEEELDPDALITIDEDDNSDIDGNNDDDDEDSDLEPYPMEDESDNEYQDGANVDPKKRKPKSPVYISELAAYLKDQEDPEKLEIGLKGAESLLRQKIGVGTEIDEWAITLAKRIIYFPDSYEITDSAKLQQRALVALMVACPNKIVRFSIEQVFDQNTSINQKNIILSSISIAAYELSGWDTIDEKNKSLENEMEKLNLITSSSSSPLSLEKLGQSHGEVLFSSTRQQAEKKRQQNIRRNQLSGLAASVFFFPLVVGWWEALQTRMKWIEQDPMLVERFIMTLNVIMQCASHTPDRRKIVKEYFEYALSLRYIPSLSHRVTRALLLGIHTIIHICYKDQSQLLLTDYASELSSTHDWLESLLEKEQKDEEIQQLILGILASLVQASKVNSSSY
ncbi:telomere length regulation protein-domain-containing protein [Cunninghamella echinulata]|nr:telomere length regulation protein-domain-containing protein [Cunninghamella echinulata]